MPSDVSMKILMVYLSSCQANTNYKATQHDFDVFQAFLAGYNNQPAGSSKVIEGGGNQLIGRKIKVSLF